MLNNINLFGYTNPNLYILFLITYPFHNNPTNTIFLGFLLGFILDLLTQSAGGHTIACLTIGFLRPYLANFSFGVKPSELPKKIMSKDTHLSNRILFLCLMVFTHHFILYLIIFLDPKSFILILKNTFFTALFSIILLWTTLILFQTKND
jgi:hypothetical protein